MRSDGEKTTTEFMGDFTILHIVWAYPVSVEFFSQLFSVPGTGSFGMQSHSILSAFMVKPG